MVSRQFIFQLVAFYFHVHHRNTVAHMLTVMSYRSPVIVRSQCRKVAILEVFFNTSLIISVLVCAKSNRLEADTSGVLPVFPKKSLRSGFRTSLFDSCHDETVIDFMAISTLEIAIVCIAIKMASCMRFSTVKTASLTTSLILSSILFFMT